MGCLGLDVGVESVRGLLLLLWVYVRGVGISLP